MRALLLALPLASGFTLTSPRPTVTNRATTVMMPEMANGKMQVSMHAAAALSNLSRLAHHANATV